MMRIERIPVGLLFAGLSMVLLAAEDAAAQRVGRVASEENFRRDPNGELIGRLSVGAPLRILDRQDNWLRVEVSGWMWERSLQASDREDFDLVVSESEGENLRDAPSGEIVGRFGRGTLLTRGAREPGWLEVTRTGWIWGASVEEQGGAAAATPESPAANEDPPAETSPSATNPAGFARTGADGAAVLTAPDGDTLAIAAPGADLEVVARDGNWARVRVEGWAWLPAAAEDAPAEIDEALTPQALEADPTGFRGRVASWALQFISLERAEGVRTDFFEGEPFLLTRYGGPDGPFVYVAVPPAQVEVAESLLPLERLTVVGRVRTGASVLTGTPILDLISLERIRREP